MQIHIHGLKKSFGTQTAVDIEQYTIHSGELWGLVGNNGAGKTTLFRLMLDLLKADAGSVTLGGIDVSRSEEWKRQTGAYIDSSFLIDYLTPQEYFRFVGKAYGLSVAEVNERLVVFEHFADKELWEEKKLIRHLSAGNRQKTGIIAAMLHRPSLLILDEPFNFLDPSSQSHIKRMLTDYRQETGATILLSSHNLNHTADICQRIALLEKGCIIQDLDNADGSAGKALEHYFDTVE